MPLAFNAAFFALGSSFNYPAVLRQPTDEILTQFTAGGDGLIALWYAFSITAALAIPLALLLYGEFKDDYPQTALAAAIVGTMSGLVQVVGLLRWVFLVPGRAAIYVDAAADPASLSAATLIYESAHHFLGVAVGEHLGYLFTGSWTILLSVMMFRSRTFRPWLGVIGLISAVGVMVGLLEPSGWADAGAVNAIAYIVWSLWLIVMGVVMLTQRQPARAR